MDKRLVSYEVEYCGECKWCKESSYNRIQLICTGVMGDKVIPNDVIRGKTFPDWCPLPEA